MANPNYQGDATATAESLLRALDTERLREMAGNPFFLTAMAALHQPDRPLPDTGAKLMDLLVRAVLEESRKRRADAQSPGDTSEVAHLLEKIPSGFTLLRKRLQSIAFTAREQRQGRDGRLISEDLLKHRLVLAKELPAGWVDDLVDALRHRAGLLQSKDGIEFEFAYRFEEFLAGCHLADDDAWPKTAFFERCRDLFRKQGDYARLPVLWAAGFKVHVRESQSPVRDLVSVLVPANPVTTAASLADLELAADIARDARMAAWLDDDVPDTSAVVTRLRSQLEKVRDGTQPIATRARAASAIGRFGDERDGVGLDATRKFPQFAWIKLSKGPFIMGSKAGVGDDDERPQMPKCSLIQQDYSISRYPVTVAQYAAFVDDDGYAAKHEACWTKAGWQWRTKNKITGPHNQTDSVFQTPNHPRVGVSWYEAFAFCRWLTGKLRTAGLIENDEAICLPTEAQWERAARHTDGRTYPWGNEDKAIAEFCNTGNTGLNKTSAVGLFPHGRAKCEAEDMAGNVWEWCLTPWLSDYAGYEAKVGALEAEPEKITTGVLRGGSWGLHDPRDLRCSFRAHFASDLRSNGVGFRCVWVGVGGAR